jgi:hypothetical protein
VPSAVSDVRAHLDLSALGPRVGEVFDRETARGRLLHRIQLRAGDYLNAEIGWSRWIRWGRLMGLVEAVRSPASGPSTWFAESRMQRGIGRRLGAS